MTEAQKSLDDLMVAMDVVDTLRHRQAMVDRELNADQRREDLIDKLKDIYSAQGIEVTDEVLEQGVKALEEDRFHYEAPKKSLKTWVAKHYINRGKRLKPFLVFIGFFIFIQVFHYFNDTLPEKRFFNNMPEKIQRSMKTIQQTSKTETAVSSAKQYSSKALSAINDRNKKGAKLAYNQLKSVEASLTLEYNIRVVSRYNEPSGIWRIPDVNSKARNYYIIVEAIDKSGNIIKVNQQDEEDNKTLSVNLWGLRVDQNTFQRIANDKSDDGIIQNNIVGIKKRGYLSPEYKIQTSGGTITEW